MRKTKLVDKICETEGCNTELKGVWQHRRFCNACSRKRNDACRKRYTQSRLEIYKTRKPKPSKKKYICVRCKKRPAPSKYEYCRLCKNDVARIIATTATGGNEIYFPL